MTSAFIKSFKGFRAGESEFPGRRIAKLNSTSSLSVLVSSRPSFHGHPAPPRLHPPFHARTISPLSFLVFPVARPLFFSPSFSRKLDSCFQFCAVPRKGSGPAFLCFFHFVFAPVETLLHVRSSLDFLYAFPSMFRGFARVADRNCLLCALFLFLSIRFWTVQWFSAMATQSYDRACICCNALRFRRIALQFLC